MKKITKYVSIVSFVALAVMGLQSCSQTKQGCPERIQLDILK